MSGRINWFNAVKQTNSALDDNLCAQCQRNYGRPQDGKLSFSEYARLLSDLFVDGQGIPYALTTKQKEQLFSTFDADGDGLLDDVEFQFMWKEWISVVVCPVPALLIVDVQNDFITGTLSLSHCPAGEDGAAVVPVVNDILSNHDIFRRVAYTLDWHPADHISFVENVSKRPLAKEFEDTTPSVYDTVKFACGTEQKLWPAHCVQGSWGAEFHEDLNVLPDALIVKKGANSEVDSYSAFWDNLKVAETGLAAEFKRCGITDVFVAGLAFDVCVMATSHHSLEIGFRTSVIGNACRGVCTGDIDEACKKLRHENALIVTAQEVRDLALGNDRRPEPALRHALSLSRAEIV